MANTLSACGHYGIYVALQHLCGSMCQEWSDAEPALLSRCIEGSDVLNAPGMHTNFTCVLWIYRSCPISKISGCVPQLIGIEAEQCRERLQHATCISAPQVLYAGKPYKISDSASHNSTHVYVYMYMHYDYKHNSYALRVLYV